MFNNVYIYKGHPKLGLKVDPKKEPWKFYKKMGNRSTQTILYRHNKIINNN